MVLSTLPDLPGGKRYEVKGVVFSLVMLSHATQDSLERAFQDLERQAASRDADAVIDIKITHPGGERAVAAIIGTAIKIIR